ncbi:bacteriocin [Roseivirga sp. BDSF3-8]|uniref:bacteriocin n=1 Tax=Roseivirga sp. BDSF3-8 TaxID=3241598 RepID=UPI0035326224
MSVKKTSFSKKSFATLNLKEMATISGGGDPFDPNFSDKRRIEKPKEITEESVYMSISSFLVG